MAKTKCALLDTDFISKLHITRKDDQNRFIDRILELPGYQFVDTYDNTCDKNNLNY